MGRSKESGSPVSETAQSWNPGPLFPAPCPSAVGPSERGFHQTKQGNILKVLNTSRIKYLK